MGLAASIADPRNKRGMRDELRSSNDAGASFLPKKVLADRKSNQSIKDDNDLPARAQYSIASVACKPILRRRGAYGRQMRGMPPSAGSTRGVSAGGAISEHDQDASDAVGGVELVSTHPVSFLTLPA